MRINRSYHAIPNHEIIASSGDCRRVCKRLTIALQVACIITCYQSSPMVLLVPVSPFSSHYAIGVTDRTFGMLSGRPRTQTLWCTTTCARSAARMNSHVVTHSCPARRVRSFGYLEHGKNIRVFASGRWYPLSLPVQAALQGTLGKGGSVIQFCHTGGVLPEQ